jgi:O-antigen/teichoic acid export membrane protein
VSTQALADVTANSAEARADAGGGRLAKNISLLAGGQFTTWILTGLWTVVVPRGIGPGGMGLLVTAWAAAGMMSVVVSLGTRDLLVRRMAVDPSEAPTILGTAITLRLLLAGPGLLLILAYAWLAHFGDEETAVLLTFSGTTLILLIVEPIQAAFQAIERMQYLAYTDVLSKAGVTAGGIALVLLGFGPAALVRLGISVSAFALIMNLIWIRRYVRIQFGFRWREIIALLKASMAYWAFSAFFTLYLWIDSAMLSVMTTPTVVGWYGVPTKAWGALMFIPVILATALLPRFSVANEQGLEKLREVARPFLELVVLLSLPAAVGLAMVAAPLIRLIWTPIYIPSIPIMVIITLSAPATYLSILLNQVLIARNKPWIWTRVMFGAGVLNIALNLVLIRYFQDRFGNGAIGAAISLTVTEIAVAGVGIALFRGFLTLGSLWRFLRAAVATAVMAGTIWVVASRGPVIEIAAGGVTFAVAAWLLRLATPDDVQAVRGLLPWERRRA